VSEEREPQPLLDAIADDPDAPGPWRVLADWLLERELPHGVLAAYELKLESGTNDPSLLETYAEQRVLRMQSPRDAGLTWGDATWRCGYVTRLVLELARHRGVDWGAFFAAPPLRTLSWLQLVAWGRGAFSRFDVPSERAPARDRNAAERARTLEAVLRHAPSTLRRISVFAFGGLGREASVLEPLLRPPAGVRRLDLAVTEAPAEMLTVLGAAGYPLVNLDGTKLELPAATRLATTAKSRLVLGGTGLSGRDAAIVDHPALGWCAPGVTAALVGADGRLYPLSNNASSRFHHPSIVSSAIQPSPWGWQVLVRRDPRGWEQDAFDLEDGGVAPLDVGEGRVLAGADLDARYRELLRAFAAPLG